VKQRIAKVYRSLYASFGPQHWWPAGTPFEVMVGAILTQNTSWNNVEKAIAVLHKHKLLSPVKLDKLRNSKLSRLIRPAGYYNIKAKRLKNFLKFFLKKYGGDTGLMRKGDVSSLRQELLSVNGIGNETADSILLYALGKPVFVVDAYTRRIFSRHKFFRDGLDYQTVQDFFEKNTVPSVKLYNEFHALIVKLGKDYCLKNKPRCTICPLNNK